MKRTGTTTEVYDNFVPVTTKYDVVDSYQPLIDILTEVN